MPRRAWGTTPTQQRGVECRRCGADEWKKRSKQWVCRLCMNDHARKYRARTDGPLRLWRRAKDRAKRAGVAFKVTVIDVERAWPHDERCPVLGVRFKWQDYDAVPSLDRIDASRGYIPGNVAVISNRANRIKSDATADELERVATWLRSVQ